MLALIAIAKLFRYYDPMICKLCTHGEDRTEAIDRMVEALDSYVIEGLKHNVPLLYDIVNSDEFRRCAHELLLC